MTENLPDLIWVPSHEFLNQERRFIADSIAEIGVDKINSMVVVAVKYRGNAYTPYSNYDVGASVLTITGKIYAACNSENVGYSPTNHAEGTAIAIANNTGIAKENRKYIKAVAVVHGGDSGPCGECLQRIVEHADNCLIIIADPEGNIRKLTSLKTLLPDNFNPSHLGL